jgi:hypothetical protein
VESEEAHLTPAQDTGNAALGHAQVGSDADPDDDERGEDPEQERGLTDGKPRQLAALEEELNPAGATSANVQLDDFTAHRRGGVARRLPFIVAVDDGRSRHSRARHRPSVARDTWCAIGPERSSR